MRSNDIQTRRDELRAKMQQAIKAGDVDGFFASFDDMQHEIERDIKEQYQEALEGARSETDSRVLAARGVRQLTSKELDYYNKLSQALKSRNPRQALTDLDVVMPETVIDSVFENLQTEHPLLSKINFISTNAAIRFLYNTNGYQEAQWGQLCDEIVKELVSGFKEIDTGLFKLSAFMPVCKAMLDLGPQWLDNYVRQVLYEAFSNGLEAATVNGDGNNKPIGMTRQVGDGVSVSGGVYPLKEAIKVSDLSPATLGNLISLMAVDPNGKFRRVTDLILVVSPQDYFQRIMPATTIMAPDGTFRNDVLPYPVTIIQSAALDNGEAVLGMGYRYFAAVGSSPSGNIEYSDHYRFLEDERVYLIKGYANGLPLDNNSFLRLDISGLQPAVLKVQTVEAPAASNDATLTGLTIGNLTLNPVFASGTTSYTAATTNATNIVRAVPTHAGATVAIINKDTDGSDQAEVANGTAATWYTGSNTLTITVTAADGETTKAYTVTVTKS